MGFYVPIINIGRKLGHALRQKRKDVTFFDVMVQGQVYNSPHVSAKQKNDRKEHTRIQLLGRFEIRRER